MHFKVIHVSRGDIRLESNNKQLRVLGEALVASEPTEPSYVIYLNSLNTWEAPSNVPVTKTEKKNVIMAIKKHFEDLGTLIEFV